MDVQGEGHSRKGEGRKRDGDRMRERSKSRADDKRGESHSDPLMDTRLGPETKAAEGDLGRGRHAGGGRPTVCLETHDARSERDEYEMDQ